MERRQDGLERFCFSNKLFFIGYFWDVPHKLAMFQGFLVLPDIWMTTLKEASDSSIYKFLYIFSLISF